MLQSAFRKWFPKQFAKIRVWRRLFFAQDSYIYSTGLLRSFEENKPVDQNGRPLPWMNYDIVNFLESRLDKELSVFEFGSGYSTHFFARLCGHVTSVEHNRSWYERVKLELPNNARLVFSSDARGVYSDTILSTDQVYDVVIVDGLERVECLIKASERLTQQGILILDDSDRTTFATGKEFLKNRGFRSIEFQGLKPKGWHLACTEIFYRSTNCLGI